MNHEWWMNRSQSRLGCRLCSISTHLRKTVVTPLLTETIFGLHNFVVAVLLISHDSYDLGTPWWRHQMKIFTVLLALCSGNSQVTGEFPSQRPVTQSFDVSLICALNKRLVNSPEAGDLRRHRAHYDVIVMHILHGCFVGSGAICWKQSWMKQS